ncbi:glycosyltransferase [Nitrincola tapanii]|uniref:Glycosyltransferase n=1 Tax=Nitrincola tapanii TaxID=1708751 RepID=A0A5A9W0Y0_9GAMM|nr:glycosyltransferase [Nitrincola tapanii]KAA0874376.1 glycosyltransferase [Nitrincola tapanii]
MIDKKPCVAILLAAHNGSYWLKEQIDSILNQKNVSIKLFISVDLSVDGTEAFVDELSASHANIFVLPHGCQFGSAGPNFFRLMREVNFDNVDYVAFSDQDDIWFESKLSHSIDCIVNEGLDAYSSDLIAFWSNGKNRVIKKSQPLCRYDYYFESGGAGCTFVFPIRSFLEIRKFLLDRWSDVSNFERHDWLIYAIGRSKGFLWKIDSVPMVYYRQHDNNQVGANVGLGGMLARFDQISNGWYFEHVNFLVSLLSDHDKSGFRNERFFLIRNIFDIRRKKLECFYMLILLLFGKYQ